MSATNRGSIREPHDFYATPHESYRCLEPFIPRDGSIWEPAEGDGRIVSWLRHQLGIDTHGGDLQKGYNFLGDEDWHHCIITNPPYSLAFEFCQHAVKRAGHVFLLLRLNFLASKKRREWFKENEPAALIVLSERPSFTGSGTDATDYAWFYWGHKQRGIFHV
jgi:hypothetical protein